MKLQDTATYPSLEDRVVVITGGGSGIGAYIQLEHASSGINSKLMGNNDSYLNQFHGNLAIG